MSKTNSNNRLKVLIHKIAVDRIDMEIVNTIVEELAIECKCHIKSVQRWMNNKSQPSATDLNRIILLLNKYDSAITYNDYFGTNETKSETKNGSRSLKLVK
jgi:signal recognition particle subunit SEC65